MSETPRYATLRYAQMSECPSVLKGVVGIINTMLYPIKFNSNTIELTVHTSCYCVSDLLCVMFITDYY